ncbi:hypothetical protein [Streptomyces sp. NPDC006463]|uniref:hypothetical protein n=1 Tax=Streptomyces sp. NPDC006463 TaxID=3364746 RepID=UPI00368B8D31
MSEALEAAYWDADRTEVRSFQLAKMRASVLKGELLGLLLDRRAHEHRGLTVGDYAESLGVKRQYVYDLGLLPPALNPAPKSEPPLPRAAEVMGRLVLEDVYLALSPKRLEPGDRAAVAHLE